MTHDFLGCFRPTPQQALLIKAALLDGDAARTAHREWRQTADIDLLENASNRILPLLGQNLGRLGIGDPDLPRLRGARRQQLYRNRTMFHTLVPALEGLAARGIPVMLLKGAAICAAIRGDWSLRHMSDIDILVPSSHALQAWQEFERCGWHHTTPDRAATPTETVRYFPNIPFKFAGGTRVDLHWGALWQRRHDNQETAFWRESTEIDCNGVLVRILAPGHQLLQILAHAVLTLSSPSHSFDWVADAHAILLSQRHRINWDEFVRFARERNLSRTLSTQLAWLRDELAAPVPERVILALRSERPRLLELTFRGRRLGSLGSLWILNEVWNDPSFPSLSSRIQGVWRALAWFYRVPPPLVPLELARKALTRAGRFVCHRWKARRTPRQTSGSSQPLR
jgi:Uncharacterised nucleotidyltransferase